MSSYGDSEVKFEESKGYFYVLNAQKYVTLNNSAMEYQALYTYYKQYIKECLNMEPRYNDQRQWPGFSCYHEAELQTSNSFVFETSEVPRTIQETTLDASMSAARDLALEMKLPPINCKFTVGTISDSAGGFVTGVPKGSIETHIYFGWEYAKANQVGSQTAIATDTGNKPFADVASNAYYADAVKWAVEKNITAGTTAATFAPDATCTNGQILTFLWRASGQPEPTVYSELEIDDEGLGTVKVNGQLGYVGPDSPLLNAEIMAGIDTSGSFYLNPFKDVKANDYFYKAAVWAYENDMVSGNVFNSATPCTRSQTVMYLWKLAGSPEQAPIAGLADVSSSAEYAVAVAWAVEQGITSGTSA